jgi:hypothetical protein
VCCLDAQVIFYSNENSTDKEGCGKTADFGCKTLEYTIGLSLINLFK